MLKLSMVFDEILEDASENDIDPKKPDQDAAQWFYTKIRQLGYQNNLVNRQVIGNESERARGSIELGKMYFFRYIPKTQSKLPFWDEFPLVIPVNTTTRPRNAFYGLNLHYLPPQVRLMFLEQLIEFRNNDSFDGSTRIELSYDEMRRFSRLRFFKPTFKKYLINRVASQFLEIDSTEWLMAPFLPLEEFRKKDSATVWRDALSKI